MISSIKYRVVCNSNVLISGIFWTGAPKIVIDHIVSGKFFLLLSPFILAEIINFMEDISATGDEIEIIKQKLESLALKVNPKRKVKICRDVDDNQVLDLCLAGNADFLVTGDKDLLTLKKFGSTLIVPPSEFLKILGKI